MSFKREIITTADGSNTLFLPEINEHYHSHHGAVQEAQHVFLKNGLHPKKDHSEISILEIGFGTGLNAFLTAIESLKNQQTIHYTSLETNPLSVEESLQLNYHLLPEFTAFKDLFLPLHTTKWEEQGKIHEHFYLEKIQARLQDYLPQVKFDLIYFDAFGPRVQPEMWSAEWFQKLYDAMNKDGILVTYCAKGQVKRDLKSVGFQVETLEGPPGKREMTRAWKRN